MWKAIGMVGMLAAWAAPLVTLRVAAPRARRFHRLGGGPGLPTEAEVLVTVNGSSIRHGLVVNVTGAALTIRDLYRINVSVIPREQVARVTQRTMISSGRDPWYVSVPITAAVLGGLGA